MAGVLQYEQLSGFQSATDDDYPQDYATFLRSVLKVSDGLPKQIHIDHVYNRERAKQMQKPFHTAGARAASDQHF
jgi:hypothetical protein